MLNKWSTETEIWEQRTTDKLTNRVKKTWRQQTRDKDRPRWTDTGKQNNDKIFGSEREVRELECRMFLFHPPIVSSRQSNGAGACRCGAHLMNGPVCTGLLPVRMLPLGLSRLFTNTNGPNGAQSGVGQWIAPNANNMRVTGFIPNNYPC